MRTILNPDKSLDLTSREMVIYTELDDNRIDSWVNPWTQETVPGKQTISQLLI